MVDPVYLRQFYEQSLQSSNFSGLGHMMSYLEKYGVDISEWSMGSFKGPLEYSLNTRFNLSSVLVFTKYYTYFHDCRLRKEINKLDTTPLSQLTENEKYALNARVFNTPALVDMRALFGFLVQNLGTKSAIDPVSKEDALWRIVDFFSQRAITELTPFS